MGTSRSCRDVPGPDGAAVPQAPSDTDATNPPPWEQIDTGRYMPRRIRGSCRGRELG
jgi:hypothetical protein